MIGDHFLFIRIVIRIINKANVVDLVSENVPVFRGFSVRKLVPVFIYVNVFFMMFSLVVRQSLVHFAKKLKIVFF